MLPASRARKQDPQNVLSTQFHVWKPSIPKRIAHELTEDIGSRKIQEVEWMSDLFDATTLTEKVSLNQLKSCHLTSKQTQIVATLIPDEIINSKDLERKEVTTFVGILLFSGVSGLTALCEKYNNTGKGGTYRLTATLNSYIGAMVEVIYLHGGDVLKFSGDAFLATWKVKREECMFQVIHKVIRCALYIQQTLGSYETDVKVLLKVKLAISAGNMTFSIIGEDKSKHYIICGTPINDVKIAEHACVSGDVVLSPSAWEHCCPSKYEYTYKDSSHVKVTRIIYNPGFTECEVVQPFHDVNEITDVVTKTVTFDVDLQDSSKQTDNSDSDTEQEEQPKHAETIRPCVKEASRKRLGLQFRPFLIPLVVQQVDADQPLEFLTEMRQVTTMFVNLIPSKIRTHTLIQMVDEAYIVICRLVCSALGCVNKVCLFDKDVMFLVIFGLRGCKQATEGQIGLKCAYNVRQAVSELHGVASAAVGVTTGMVYCGVVGHPLRREYTVIGASVNKAARIMCAYPGKVTCDQITYSHSKLPAFHFILQESKELKGIGTVESIYEYAEGKRKYPGGDMESGMFPLLGRNEVIQMYQSLLDAMDDLAREHSGMVIHGDARIGKSRLLDELVVEARNKGFTPELVMLNKSHMSVPYATVQQILKKILNISDTASSRDKEEQLMALLRKQVSSDELCYLNDVMQVKFPHSSQYLLETQDMRIQAMHGIFRKMVQKNSKKLVVAIDDAQYIDRNSWDLLTDILEVNSTLLLLTIFSGSQNTQAEAINKILDHEKVIKVHLSGLEEECLAPLACQILNVKALAPELLLILKNRSRGIPGWCESFLMSLLQIGGLKIEEISKTEVKERSLILPDTRYLEKQPMLKTKSLKSLRDKSYDQYNKDTLDEEAETVPACVVASGYNISDKEVPQKMDAMIMTAFDSLSPYEQLLLKCASVLGITFTRTMLLAVMHNPVPQQTAQAVKHLFEMRVLNCGTEETSSNKTQLQTNYVVQTPHATLTSSHDHTVICHCNVIADDVLCDGTKFPKYAFCRLLHFKIPLFRETTYELLPGNQKKEFHARAVTFLENEAHKCAACGGGEFIYIPPKNTPPKSENEISDAIILTDSVIAPRKSTMSAKHSSKMVSTPENINLSESTSSTTAADNACGARLTAKVRVTSLVRLADVSASYISFSHSNTGVDFRNCECPLILAGVYQQLIDHCAAARLREKQIRFLIEYGAAAITIGNDIQAINLLTEAQELSKKAQIEGDVHNLSRAIQHFNLGKIHALIGQAHLDLGQLVPAKKHLNTAMKSFGKSFFTFPVISGMNLQWQLYKQWLHQQFPKVFIGRASGRKALLYDEVAAGLSHLSNLYMVEHNWCLAKLAAIKSLNLVQNSNSNLYELCAAYSNMMDVYHHYGNLKQCKKLEIIALHTCKSLYLGSEAKELLALGRLYCATFSSRLLRGELISSIKLGFKTLQISGRVFANNVKLFVLPMLIQALVMNARLDEAADLLHELAFTAEEDLDKSSTTWYHALCLDMVLDTCFTVEKASICCQYAENLLNDLGMVVRDPDSVRRLIISAWVWFTRTRQKDQAKKWGYMATKYKDIRLDDSFSNMVSALKYLECLLLTMANNMDTARPSEVSHLRVEAKEFIKKLQTVAKRAKIIFPRFLHLKAYFYCIQQYKAKGMQMLSEAKSLSEEQNFHLETAWIKHSKMVWNLTINNIDLDFWKEHTSDAKCIDWHEYTLHNLSQVTYSLRIPKATV